MSRTEKNLGDGRAVSSAGVHGSMSIDEAMEFLGRMNEDPELREREYCACPSCVQRRAEVQIALEVVRETLAAGLRESRRHRKQKAKAREYRTALQDAQGILLNGGPGWTSMEERVQGADARITRALTPTSATGSGIPEPPSCCSCESSSLREALRRRIEECGCTDDLDPGYVCYVCAEDEALLAVSREGRTPPQEPEKEKVGDE